ncbi:MAG: response regulator [Candidatus Hodarchaeota archaeon]
MRNNGFDPSKFMLMVVDDNTDTRNLAKKILEYEGFQVILASNGEEALQKISVSDVDLVLLDVRMPHLNGFEVCSLIKNMEGKEKIPLVIFFTVMSLNADKEKGDAVGGDGFLIKPFTALELISYIKSKLKDNHVHREIVNDAITVKDFKTKI